MVSQLKVAFYNSSFCNSFPFPAQMFSIKSARISKWYVERQSGWVTCRCSAGACVLVDGLVGNEVGIEFTLML